MSRGISGAEGRFDIGSRGGFESTAHLSECRRLQTVGVYRASSPGLGGWSECAPVLRMIETLRRPWLPRWSPARHGPHLAPATATFDKSTATTSTPCSQRHLPAAAATYVDADRGRTLELLQRCMAPPW